MTHNAPNTTDPSLPAPETNPSVEEADGHVPLPRTGPTPGPELRHFIECLAIYPRALYDLGRVIKTRPNQKFSIGVVPLEPPRAEQASIAAAMGAAFSDATSDEIDTYMQVVRRAADGDDEDKARVALAALDEHAWAQSFPGARHCAAGLACEVLERSQRVAAVRFAA